MFKFLERFLTPVILGVRIAIVLAFALMAVIQIVGGYFFWSDSTLNFGPKLAVTITVVVGFTAAETVGWCLWKMLTLVKRDSVFSPPAFKYVDITIIAMIVGAVSIQTFGFLVAANDDAPGAVLFGGFLAVMIGGAGLVVAVLRMLLSRALSMQTELGEVI